MKNKKTKTYYNKLMEDKDFQETLDQEYETLIISEKIAKLRHKAKLTQEELAQKVKTTKSAISRYEKNHYKGYSVALLQKIASGCNAKLHISFITDRKIDKIQKKAGKN